VEEKSGGLLVVAKGIGDGGFVEVDVESVVDDRVVFESGLECLDILETL